MNIINKIEIHRFRSIGHALIPVDELTIFSGKNNSGKSNVLRALNLFFNEETSFGNPYEFSKDYNRAYTGQVRGRRAITITIHFHGQGTAALEKPFSISRTFEDGIVGGYIFNSTDMLIDKKLALDDGNVKRQFTTFLNKIEYFYIPAVRDKKFVQSLFLNFEKLIDLDQDSNFEQKIDELSEMLAKRSNAISREFEGFIDLPTQAALSSRITDILGAVEVNVDSGIEVTRRIKGEKKKENLKINIFSSGDGILMSYLAYFLAHICDRLQNKRFIWGFEEPENSLEYSKVQKLAENFNVSFRKNAQIFLTTHSPAFINLREEDSSLMYRVFLKPNDPRKTTGMMTLSDLKKQQQRLFEKNMVDSVEYRTIQKELGLVECAQEIEKVVESLIREQKDHLAAKEEFLKNSKRILRSRPKKIFICEDSATSTIRLWEHLLNLYGVTDVKVITSEGSGGDFVENGIMYQTNIDTNYSPVVFRQVDRDGLTDKQIAEIKDKLNRKYAKVFAYEFSPLPVNEIENFAVIKDEYFDDSFWGQNGEHIVEEFEKTAVALVRKFDRLFEYASLNFRKNGDVLLVMQEMRLEAKKNWKYLMPGKTMSKLKTNFSPIAHLTALPIEDLPEDLRNYMIALKSFFEGSL